MIKKAVDARNACADGFFFNSAIKNSEAIRIHRLNVFFVENLLNSRS